MERFNFLEQMDLLDRNKVSLQDMLDECGWTDDLSSFKRNELASYFQAYSAPVGTMILQEGERTSFFVILCEGTVDVVKESSAGRLKRLKTFSAGKVLGEMAFFDHCVSSTTVVVTQKATLLLMDEHSFKTMCSHSPGLALTVTIKLIRTLSNRLREASGKLIDHL